MHWEIQFVLLHELIGSIPAKSLVVRLTSGFPIQLWVNDDSVRTLSLRHQGILVVLSPLCPSVSHVKCELLAGSALLLLDHVIGTDTQFGQRYHPLSVWLR